MTDWHTTRHGNVGNTGQKGEAHHKAKLTDADVRAIRERYVPQSLTDGLPAMAKDYGVHFSTVADVVRRRSWRHLT